MLGVHGGDGQDNEESDESDDDDDRKEAHVPQLLFSLRYTKVIEPEKVSGVDKRESVIFAVVYFTGNHK
jgi:hypothetical protein